MSKINLRRTPATYNVKKCPHIWKEDKKFITEDTVCLMTNCYDCIDVSLEDLHVSLGIRI